MPFIRYHKQVADYLMGLTEVEPPVDERWPHAAAFVEPQIDYRRSYITAAERAKEEGKLYNKLYLGMRDDGTYPPAPYCFAGGQIPVYYENVLPDGTRVKSLVPFASAVSSIPSTHVFDVFENEEQYLKWQALTAPKKDAE